MGFGTFEKATWRQLLRSRSARIADRRSLGALNTSIHLDETEHLASFGILRFVEVLLFELKKHFLFKIFFFKEKKVAETP